MKKFKPPDCLKGKISEENYNRWLYREVNQIYKNLKELGCREFISLEELLEIAHQTVEKAKGKVWIACTPTVAEALEPAWDKIFTEQEESSPDVPVLVLNQDPELLRRICSEKVKDELLSAVVEIAFSSGSFLTLRMKEAISIPESWLKRKLTVEEVRELYFTEPESKDLEELEEKIKEGYEIWEFESPPDTRKNLCGCAGVCLVKDGIVGWFLVTRGN